MDGWVGEWVREWVRACVVLATAVGIGLCITAVGIGLISLFQASLNGAHRM